jgi:riboflavin kinase/FMN adenylyltransferase
MELWRAPFAASSAKKPLLDGSVLTLGNFDGVHAGHRRLIENTVKAAKKRGLPPIAITFEPHPLKVISPASHPGLLMTLAQRLSIFEALGIAVAWVIPFSREFSELEPDAFLKGLKENLNPVELHVGRAFRFGRDRSGNASSLKAWGNISCCSVHTHAYQTADGGVLSSSNIRQLLIDGKVDSASALLGVPFRLTGVVIEGDRRGRSLGFPTANLAWEQELLPGHGVYATSVHCHVHLSGQTLGLTNVGIKPTFMGKSLTVETFLPNVDANLYGTRLELDFLHKMRDEERFDNSESLRAKIAQDVEKAVSMWKSGQWGSPILPKCSI